MSEGQSPSSSEKEKDGRVDGKQDPITVESCAGIDDVEEGEGSKGKEEDPQSEREPETDTFRTPALPRHRLLNTSRSKDASISSRRTTRRGRSGLDEEEDEDEAEDLTSSALKGSAAISLLGLRARG